MCLFRKKSKDKKREPVKIVVDNKNVSKITEGYNRLCDNILFMNADGKKQVIQIESSLAHEGKTTIACNLAVALSYTHKKVCIVDLDFRRPTVHRTFGLLKEDGVADYVLGKIEKEKIIKHTSYKDVDIVTRGSRVDNATYFLISDKFKEFMDYLRASYDYIIVDCAPILQVSDYIHISKNTDGVLFVVAYGITTKAQVTDAVNELKNNNIPILGTVFSMYDSKHSDGYGSYGRYYYRAYNNVYTSDDIDFEEEVEEKK